MSVSLGLCVESFRKLTLLKDKFKGKHLGP